MEQTKNRPKSGSLFELQTRRLIARSPQRRIYFGRIVGSAAGGCQVENDRHIYPSQALVRAFPGQLLWAGRARRRISPACRRATPLPGWWPWCPAARWCLVAASLRRRATRRISRGRWRGVLSRWRRWRRRSLSGCRAGRHQSCQDQKKRFSLHGEQMLPRLPLFPAGGETDWRIRSTGHQDSFSALAAA